MYSAFCSCYEVYSGGAKKREESRAAEMGCYPSDLCFDGDERAGGTRAAKEVFSQKRGSFEPLQSRPQPTVARDLFLQPLSVLPELHLVVLTQCSAFFRL